MTNNTVVTTVKGKYRRKNLRIKKSPNRDLLENKYPDIKKNNSLPIAPPDAKNEILEGNKASECELIISTIANILNTHMDGSIFLFESNIFSSMF